MAGRHTGCHTRPRAFRLKVKASPAARLSSRQGSAPVPGSCAALDETRASNVSALQHQQQHAITCTSAPTKHRGACNIKPVQVPAVIPQQLPQECGRADILQHVLHTSEVVLACQSWQCRQLQAGRHLEMYLSIRMRRRNGGRWVLLSDLCDCCWYSRLHHVWPLHCFSSMETQLHARRQRLQAALESNEPIVSSTGDATVFGIHHLLRAPLLPMRKPFFGSVLLAKEVTP